MNKYVRKQYKDYAAYPTADDTYEVYLYANENPLNLFDELDEHTKARVFEQAFNRYPDSASVELRQSYCDYLDAGLTVDNVMAGNGSDELIRIIGDAFLEVDDVVMSCEPTFSMYARCAEVARAKYVPIAPINELLEPDIDGLIRTANKERAKVIFLCTPNNPTGFVWRQEDIVRVIEQTEAVIVLDEAYVEFSNQSNIELISRYDRVIILRTLSKAFSLAGLRVGFALSCPDNISALLLTKDTYNVNVFSQAAAIALLDRADIIATQTNYLLNERIRLSDELQKFSQLTVFPSVTNFILLKTDEQTAKKLFSALKQNGILIRDYGGSNADKLRITVGEAEENDRLLAVFSEVLG